MSRITYPDVKITERLLIGMGFFSLLRHNGVKFYYYKNSNNLIECFIVGEKNRKFNVYKCGSKCSELYEKIENTEFNTMNEFIELFIPHFQMYHQNRIQQYLDDAFRNFVKTV